MEDMFQHRRMQTSDFSFFGIYDGHAGVRAAQWLCDHLASRLESALAVDPNPPPSGLEESVKRVFLEVDSDFVREAMQGRWHDGSTAICVLVRGRELVVCNTGDSRAVLSRLGQAMPMSMDHKPSVPSERERILANGGTVDLVGVARVNGVLATSRTFGDGAFKIKNIVTAEPEVRIKEISPGDEFIILASDGLWDVMSSQAACDVAARAGSAKEAAKMLVEEALIRGTKDNVTAAVVDLVTATGSVTFRPTGPQSPSSSPSSAHSQPELPFSIQLLLKTSPLYSGWLKKQQSKKNIFGSQSWQQRWYGLYRVEQAVDYDASVHQEWSMAAVVLGYHGSRADSLKGTVPPRKPHVLHPDYRARRETIHDVNGMFFFSVQDAGSGKVLLLAGQGEGECSSWIAAINGALQDLPTPPKA